VRAWIAIVLLSLLACAPPPLEPEPVGPAVVRTWLDGAPVAGGGILVVQVEADEALTLDVPEPEVVGLSFVEDGEERVESLGDRSLVTRRYRFSGRPGLYKIGPLSVDWGEGDSSTASSSPLYIDLEVPPPRESELTDPEEAPAVLRLPWTALYCCVSTTGLAGLCLLLLSMWMRRERAQPPVPVEPPDVIALRAWTLVLHDSELEDLEKATAISRIFREYLEAVFDFPATAWTTSEILDRLGTLTLLVEKNVPQARALLRATDRVKFADGEAGARLFGELDKDLRSFIDDTRPRRFGETPP